MAEVDFANPPDPLPCNNLLNGETEDYGVFIADNNAGAIAFFESNQRNTCNGQVAFRNNSFPNATGFEWFFGDGGTSTDEHPVYQYTSTGFFDVTLIAKNGFGADTLVKPAYIQVTGTSGLPLASCYPITQFINKEFGIFRLQLENINSTNNIGQGYEDYSCADTTSLNEGNSYGFLVNTGSNYFGRVGIWIDYNNDGDFDDADENIFLGNNLQGNHLGNFTVPAVVSAQSQFIRLRVVCDQLGSPAPGPCLDPEYGQVEDYAVFISPSGLNDLINSNVNVYPNPVENFLFLDYPKEWEVGINLFDLKGIKVLSIEKLSESKIDLSDINQGLYLLEVRAKGQSGHYKLIKK
jgi:PKD repeat protein